MDACGCESFASFFDERTAERDRDRYRRSGPDRTTRQLLDLLERRGVDGATLLDVGGGIGIIDHELLARGVRSAVLADASTAYLAVARDEAERSGLVDRLEIVEGDFVGRAAEIEPADIVTLDRVVCCYPDMPVLVARSAGRAQRLYGLVLPRDRWITRAVLWVEGLLLRLRSSPYRPYAHRNRDVDAQVAAQGLRPIAESGTFLWRVVVYEREPGSLANLG